MKLIYKVIAGLADGAVGSDLVKIFDENKDGKVTPLEVWKQKHKIKKMSLGQWLKIVVSTGITIFAILK